VILNSSSFVILSFHFIVVYLGFTELFVTNCRLVCFWRDSPKWGRASSFTRFLDHTQRRTTVGRAPLDVWSARRRDLYPFIY
jgi:hypothetical protein